MSPRKRPEAAAQRGHARPCLAGAERSSKGAVRRAGGGDLDRVAALWSAMAAHHAAFDPLFTLRPDAEAEIRSLVGALRRDPDAELLVWEVGDDLPGFCAVRVDRAPPIFAETVRAEITDLVVREDRRRCGGGRALATAALAWVGARGVDRVEVRVAAANPEGQAFWRALGFGDLMDVLQRRL